MDSFQEDRRGAPSSFLAFFVCIVLSLLLLVTDHKSTYLEKVRSAMTYLIYPIQVVGALPSKLGRATSGVLTERSKLNARLVWLEQQNLLLQTKAQQFEALRAENARLRKLFAAARRTANKYLMAELLEVSLEAFSQRIIIDKGSQRGVYVGQSVIDADGVMGQVTHVYPLTSAVTLITDPSAAIPVEVQRNALRAILFGTGSAHQLELRHLSKLADVREGDVLVTSGLGGRYPAGFPVARIVRIKDTGEAFLSILARPMADLNRSKEVLLIWPGGVEKTPVPPAPGVSELTGDMQ
ncbi:MAG: rod shape-determining protein MreC [Gammaproteobacteria bacterium]|nr:MAG: rod shape-determining protein MreC [Gammaproteobacteria bacterium]